MSYYDCQDWREMDYLEATVINRLNNMGDQLSEFTTTFNAHNHNTYHYLKAESDSLYWNFTTQQGNYDKLDGYEGEEIRNLGLLLNGIYLWGGLYANIPSTFKLCDGMNNTPNLVGRQLVGAGNAYLVNATGGSDTIQPTGTLTIGTHALTIAEMPSHRHTYVNTYNSPATDNNIGSYYLLSTVTNNTGISGESSPHGHPGSTFTGAVYEKSGSYIKLPFIKKIS